MECEAPEQTAEHDPSKRVMYLKSRTTKLAIDFGPVLHDEPLVPGVLVSNDAGRDEPWWGQARMWMWKEAGLESQRIRSSVYMK